MFKKFINLGAVYYTAITAVMLVISMMFGGEDGSALSLGAWNFLTILFFSFSMSLGNLLRDGKIMTKTAGIICHAVCHVGGFFVFVMLCNDAGFTMTVIGTAIFAACYAAVCIIKSIVIKKKSSNKKQSMGSKQRNEKNEKPAKLLKKQRAKKAEKKNQGEYKSLFSDDNEVI